MFQPTNLKIQFLPVEVTIIYQLWLSWGVLLKCSDFTVLLLSYKNFNKGQSSTAVVPRWEQTFYVCTLLSLPLHVLFLSFYSICGRHLVDCFKHHFLYSACPPQAHKPTSKDGRWVTLSNHSQLSYRETHTHTSTHTTPWTLFKSNSNSLQKHDYLLWFYLKGYSRAPYIMCCIWYFLKKVCFWMSRFQVWMDGWMDR